MSEPATHKYKVILYFEWKDATVCRIIEDNEWSIRNVCKCFQIKKKKNYDQVHISYSVLVENTVHEKIKLFLTLHLNTKINSIY